MSRPHLSDEAGFTLVELLVTMLIATVVLFATLRGGELFASTQKTTGDRVAAQDTARTTARQILTAMRQARLPAGQRTPLPDGRPPTRTDITVASWSDDTTGPSAAGWLRYCVSPDGRSLLMATRTGDPFVPPGACVAGTTADGWQHAPIIDGTLRDADVLFQPDSATCIGGLSIATAGAACAAGAETTTVGIRLSIAPTPSAARPAAVLSVAAALRNGHRS